MREPVPAEVAATIDHTLLRPEATRSMILDLCEEAAAFGVAGVCVAGSWVPLVAETLRGSGVRAIGVAAFPLGTASTAAKAAEVADLVAAGADEIDTVIHLGFAKGGEWDRVRDDLVAVVRSAAGRPVKAILETAALETAEIVRAAEAAIDAGVAFVKTSTGFGAAGATVETVALLRRTVGTRARVKASGGIRTWSDAVAMLAAGADRIGASSARAILAGAPS